MMEIDEISFRAAIMLALSLVIGLQRERKHSALAGIRTFPLIGFVGFFSALLGQYFESWLPAAALIALGILLATGSLRNRNSEDEHPGLTTEIAALLVFLLSAYMAVGESIALAVVAGGVAALLLHLKGPLHGFVESLNRTDVRAIMQFVLITFIILPLLPDQVIGPYDVFNPREVWMIVVLISGISLSSYTIQKVLGDRAGAVLTGLLGGLISSTATTVSYSRRALDLSASQASSGSLITLVIVLASTAAWGRIIVEIAVLAPGIFWQVAPPLIAMLVIMSALSFVAYRPARGKGGSLPASSNPAELTAAIIFAFLFAGILFLSAAAKDQFGSQGLYIVALIAGLTDVDALTISTAKLVQNGKVATDVGWRAILLASLSNLAAKAAIASVFGGAFLRRRILLYFGVAMACGILILIFWPS